MSSPKCYNPQQILGHINGTTELTWAWVHDIQITETNIPGINMEVAKKNVLFKKTR